MAEQPMSDPSTAGDVTDIADLINKADDPTWKRLAEALGVADRQAAIDICSSDPAAAAKAREILVGGAPAQPSANPDDSLLTRKAKTPSARKSLPDLMYSGVKY